MNETDVRKYAKLMQERGLTGLEIKDQGVVRLERAPASSVSAAAGAAPKIQEPAEERHASVEIRSPMVGVFYAAPTEDSEPYVKAGDHVKKGDTLCVIEAMKLMNELTAERDGVVAEICAKNGQAVEYGSVLFRMADEG